MITLDLILSTPYLTLCPFLPTRPTVSTHTREQSLPTVWGELQSPNGFREGKPNKDGGEEVERVWKGSKNRHHFRRGTAFIFSRAFVSEPSYKYRWRDKRAFYFFFMSGSSLYSRSIARIDAKLSFSKHFCKTYGKWKFLPDFGNRVSFSSSFWSWCGGGGVKVTGDGTSNSHLGDNENSMIFGDC